MSFRIESLMVRNFKCFDCSKFYKFELKTNAGPTILSGPNGFGKTTFFDAIELIFTKRITRLKVDIENGNTILGKNILLNTSKECGFLILVMVSTNYEKISIIAKIDNSIKKLTYFNGIEYTIIDGTIDLNHFDKISSEVIWKEDLKDFDSINYIKEHFNIYYYISQAESVHFLKNTIINRKDSMTKLLHLENIQNKIDKIEKQLIGKTNKSSGKINDEIKEIKAIMNEKIKTLKLKLGNVIEEFQDNNYSILLEYPPNYALKKWDQEIISLNNFTEKSLSSFVEEINGLYYLYNDLSDYRIYLENEKLKKFLEDDQAILDYIEFCQFIINNKFEQEQINSKMLELNRLQDVYKYSSFFRNELDTSNYKKGDILSLCDLGVIPENINIKRIDTFVQEIDIMKSKLGDNQKRINELMQAREKLHSVSNFNSELSKCPYCNHSYDNLELLEMAYDLLSNQLVGDQDDFSKDIKKMHNDLINYVKPVADLVKDLFNSKNIDQIREEQTQYSMFVKSERKINDVLYINQIVQNENEWKQLDKSIKIAELKRLIASHLSSYINKDFEENLKRFEYDKIYNENRKILEIDQPFLRDRINIENKINFIKYQNSIIKNNEISQIRNDIKLLLVKLNKLKEIRKNFEELKKIYNDKIEEYKNLVLSKLRVPLLIYTGKILQDYQNGLGVFINKDEMRFVSNGDAKHDILNTFSSGQLSGFVLSFLFAMNKRYISEEGDDLGFILIDDPVQTMDDINIASFIEVLRNDFPNKQIILSTHETDKENYILYKFLKYNIRGQSFNVKEKLY